MTLKAIKYNRGKLEILNQLLLPHDTVYENLSTVQNCWDAIKLMKVRGAPAIAIVGCLGIAVELYDSSFDSKQQINAFVKKSFDYLITARPTAVNLSKSAIEFNNYASKLMKDSITIECMKMMLIEKAEGMLEKDISDNKMLSKYGADHILKLPSVKSTCNILTHCNTGSLATAGYGTALGVVRSLFKQNALNHVYFTETRPYNQGARLTAYELVHDKIPSTLIADSMVALLMKTKQISAVVVGADRVAKNGDTANKIGTYQLAILAKYHNVPFYVAAPLTCHCNVFQSGEEIVIEERAPRELTHINNVKIAPDGTNCWNPAFDITNHTLITGGIITELGVFTPSEFQQLKKNST